MLPNKIWSGCKAAAKPVILFLWGFGWAEDQVSNKRQGFAGLTHPQGSGIDSPIGGLARSLEERPTQSGAGCYGAFPPAPNGTNLPGGRALFRTGEDLPAGIHCGGSGLT